MAQDVIDQLQRLCGQLREKLMHNLEYRALMSLERTIGDLSACMRASDQTGVQDEHTGTMNSLDADSISMRQGADHMADVIEDALRERKQIGHPADHLPSHRVA